MNHHQRKYLIYFTVAAVISRGQSLNYCSFYGGLMQLPKGLAGGPWIPLWDLILDLQYRTVSLCKQLTGSTSLKCSPANFLKYLHMASKQFSGDVLFLVYTPLDRNKSPAVEALWGCNAHYTQEIRVVEWIKIRQAILLFLDPTSILLDLNFARSMVPEEKTWGDLRLILSCSTLRYLSTWF